MTKRCLECLRVPCRCSEYKGMKIGDDTLIDFAVSCSDKGIALKAETVLLRRARRVKLGGRKI
jgi:hypothetical protein